jgi:hypothetical protein
MLPASLGRVVGALELLTAPDMPAVALIGGMAVNVRLSTAAEAHHATQDIDLVADDRTPTAIEVLSRGNQLAREHTVVLNGIEVDIIDTQAVTDEDLHGLDDDAKLFIAGHRWALDTAGPVRITSVGRAALTVELPVATPAGLVAAKSYAAGYPRAARRATKHGGDLYDLFRLIEVFDRRGELRSELAAAPGDLGQLVARVVRTEILANPVRALRQMAPAASTALDVDRIVDVLEPFLAPLD